jgi:hypothetical protein
VPGAGLRELTGPHGKALAFVAERVVVLERESGELARFLARRRGRILASRHGHHLVAVDPMTADPNDLAPLAEQLGAAPGTYHFDAERTQRLAALVVEELTGGLSLSLDVVTEPTSAP